MAIVSFEDNKKVKKHVVRSDKRLVYILDLIDGFYIVDPYMCRHESVHVTFEDAVSVASAFVDY